MIARVGAQPREGETHDTRPGGARRQSCKDSNATNRRWKLAAVAVAAVLVAVPLVGAALPQSVPELIEARTFRVLGEQGHVRVHLTDTGLTLFDEQGQVRVNLFDSGLAVFDEEGIGIASLPR